MALQANYDAVILGGGLAGTITAALLAKRGRRVLIIAPTGLLGGVSSSVTIGGCTFQRGTFLGLGFERDGLYESLFSEMGISIPHLKGDDHLLQRLSPYLQLVLPQHRLNLYSHTDELGQELRREFPRDTEAFLSLMSEALHLLEGLVPRRRRLGHYLSSGRDESDGFAKRLRGALRFRSLASQKAKTLLDKNQIGGALVDSLSLMTLFFNQVTLQEMSSLSFLELLQTLQEGVVSLRGGVPQLCTLLAERIRSNRGDFLEDVAVKSVAVSKKRVEGLHLENGVTVSCHQLILNLSHRDLPVIGKERFFFSFYFTVDPATLPVPMIQHLLLQPSDLFPSRVDLIFVHLQKTNAMEGLAVSCLLSGREDKDLSSVGIQEIKTAVLAQLEGLMPFATGSLKFLGDDRDVSQNGPGVLLPEGFMDLMGGIKQLTVREEVCRALRIKNLFILPDCADYSVGGLKAGWGGIFLANEINALPR